MSGTHVACIANRPVLQDGLDFYIKGYRELKSDRPVGMGTGQIPWSSIIKWCEVYQIHDINEKDAVIRYFRAMEYAEFEYEQENAKD